MTDDELIVWSRGFNDSFLPLLADESRYLILKGGGGSGKSIFAGRKVLERVTAEPGHRWLVVRKVARTLRESCFAQLRAQISEFYPGTTESINQTDLGIRFRNGSEILFAGLDDVEKLKSIYDITGIWIEEASEITEAEFNQLDIRLRTDFSEYLQMILTFNPVSIGHWLKKRFFDTRDPRATVHESTYKDNRFLTDEAIRTLEAFKDTDEYYYTVYCLGQWGTTGRSVFDAAALNARLAEIAGKRPAEGFFDVEQDGEVKIRSFRFRPESGGIVRIYAEPVPGASYVIGADTAGDGSDWFVAQVLRADTGEQAAVLRMRTDEDTFARQLYCLGRHFGDALIAVEVNFSTFPVKMLDMMRYPSIYVREKNDTFEGGVRKAYGFRTDSLTRPLIIAELIQTVREHAETINDRTTIEEMLTFVRNEKLRPEAEEGAHDDAVMALAIANHIRPLGIHAEPEPSIDRSWWTERMRKDYKNADKEGKALLRERWASRPDTDDWARMRQAQEKRKNPSLARRR